MRPPPAWLRGAIFAMSWSAACSGAPADIDDRAAFEPQQYIDHQNVPLHGVGKRTFLFFDIYAAGFYGNAPSPEAKFVLSKMAPCMIELHLLRAVSASELMHTLSAAFRRNASEKTLQEQANKIQLLQRMIARAQTLNRGDSVQIGFNGKETAISLNGKPLGPPIDGYAFAEVIFAVWLGDNPIDAALKQRLLSG
ncbi:chalcone isomerase family protein [Chromobacterium sp. ASV23]|uniref:chalcone isomerase family protein n=1 Tax=Chromobacterium sp. ASV23 TaxID=2795110 RepID=UPI0018EA8E27|nr:chalcone isomerase family protein [Chromobacterium sp. ASV23]